MAAVEKLGGRPTSAEAEAASMPTRIFARAGMLADGGSSAWAPSAAWEKATRQRVAAQAGAWRRRGWGGRNAGRKKGSVGDFFLCRERRWLAGDADEWIRKGASVEVTEKKEGKIKRKKERREIEGGKKKRKRKGIMDISSSYPR
jgi:membrane-bound ClpP family serine protease